MNTLLNRRTVTVSSLAIALAVSGASIAGRVFQAPPRGTPMVQFHTVMEDGQPVLDVKAADVTLKIAGKTREVKSVTLVQLGAGAPAAAAAPAEPAKPAGGMPVPFATNVGGGSSSASSGGGGGARVVLITLDEYSVTPGRERAVQESTAQLLAALSPNDRVGVVTIPRGLTNLAPTTDRAAVTAAIKGFAGVAASGESTDSQYCRTGVTLNSIKDVVLKMPTDDPAAVVLLSAGLQGQGEGSTCQVRSTDFIAAGQAILSAPLSFYVVHVPDALSSNSQTLTDGVNALANAASSPLVRFVGAAEGVMQRIVKETSAYYVATFDADPADKPNSRVELKVTRDKTRTRAQGSYTPDKPEAVGAAKGTPKPADMIKDPKAFRDLPLRATSFVGRGTEGKVTVTTFFESADGAAPLTAATLGLIDDKGKLIAQCSMQPADLQKAEAAKLPAIGACIAPEGTYRLRVAATDANGRAGAVDEVFNGSLTKAGTAFKTSSLMLFNPGAAGIQARLQFKDETEAIALFYLYGTPVNGIGAKGEILGADGKVIGDPFPFGLSGNPGPDQLALAAKVPIGSLAPGDYTIRVTVITPDTPETFISKTLRKIK